MMPRGLVVLCSCALVGCGQEKIDVRQGSNTDYNHGALLGAVDKFVTSGRTPAAYAELSQTALQLLPGMDAATAKEAELKLLVLALVPVKSVQTTAMPQQRDALALTVWPTLLAPELEADDLLNKRDPSAAAMLPKPDEDARSYLIRLCGAPLAADCKHIVPELQAPVVAALAARRATERVRNAVAACTLCGSDPGWHDAVRDWELLDRTANAAISDVRRQADPDNWPVAGSSAERDARLPEAELSDTGELVIGDQHHGPPGRVAALRALRADSAAIALHLRPEIPLAQVRVLLADARKAGATRVAVIARDSHYPWDRKLYWIAGGAGTSTGLRPTDSLQLLLHAVDAVAGPGAIARVD